MSFSSLLIDAVQSKSLITVQLNVDVLTGFFEDLCNRLDEFDKRINGFQEGFANKADKSDIQTQIKTITDRLDDLEGQTSLFSNSLSAHKKETDKFKTDINERLETDIGRCLVESRNLTNRLVQELEPEIVNNVLKSIPDMKQINDMKEELGKLKDGMPAGSYNISEDDLNSISSDINGRMKDEIEKLRESMKQYTDDQINSLFGRNDEQKKGLAADIANSIKMATSAKQKAEEVSIELDQKLQKSDENINKLLTESSKMQSQMNTKMNDLSLANDTMKQKMEDLQTFINNFGERLKEQDENAKHLQSQVLRDDGQIDIAPILKQLGITESKVSMLTERLTILEGKETVHPLAVSNLRDKLDVLDQQIQDLTIKLGKFESDILADQEKIKKNQNSISQHNDTLNEISSTLEKLQASIDSIKESLNGHSQDFTKMNEHIDSLKNLINEIDSKNNQQKSSKQFAQVKDFRVDNLTETVSNLQKDLENTKQQLSAVCNSLEKTLEEGANQTDIEELKADIEKIRNEIKQLIAVQNEMKDESFLPKVDLNVGAKSAVQRTSTLERSVLPRISFQKSPRDDQKLSDTANKMEKQENLLTQLKRVVEQHQKSITQLDENKADRIAAQQLFEQFRLALAELNNRIGSLKKALLGKVDTQELTNYLAEILDNTDKNETATGVETVRCICCGRKRRNVTGALDDPTLAKRLGGPVSTRVLGDGDGQVCFVYGERGDMYYGRSGTGKPIFSKPSET